MNEKVIQLQWLNPFSIFSDAPTVENITRHFLAFRPDHEKIKERFKRANPIAQRIVIVPSDDAVTTKLVTPLREAYGSLLLGNFQSTIALCGTIAEMLLIFTFDLSNFQINGSSMDKQKQQGVFGDSFESLGQDRRIKVLRTYGVITPKAAEGYFGIKNIRKQYLHLWSRSHEQIESDAFECFEKTIDRFGEVFKQTFENGKLILEPNLMKYLESKGLVSDKEVNNQMQPTDGSGG